MNNTAGDPYVYPRPWTGAWIPQRECPICKGKGKIKGWKYDPEMADENRGKWYACPTCNGMRIIYG